MKAAIRQNVYGNWYGYLGGRKVEWFTGSTTEQELAAHEWLEHNQFPPCDYFVRRRGGLARCGETSVVVINGYARCSAHRGGDQ
jgi:hypothetical protein